MMTQLTNDGSRLDRHILLIDDRYDAILPVRKMLELDGHQVSVATDGSSGVSRARELNPDVILCDLGLPGEMNGYDVAAAIRADPACRGIYLVAVSGYGEPEHRRRARQAGFDNHVVKPVSKAQLEQLVRVMPRFDPTSGD